jgi:hypothetical protein
MPTSSKKIDKKITSVKKTNVARARRTSRLNTISRKIKKANEILANIEWLDPNNKEIITISTARKNSIKKNIAPKKVRASKTNKKNPVTFPKS